MVRDNALLLFVLGCTGLGAGVSNKRTPPQTPSLELDFRGERIPKQTKHSAGGKER